MFSWQIKTAVGKFTAGAISGLPHQFEESITGNGAALPGSIPDDTIISYSSTPPRQHAAPEVMKCGCLNESKHQNKGPARWNDICAPKCSGNQWKSSLRSTESAVPQPRWQSHVQAFCTSRSRSCFEAEYLISTKQSGKEMRGNWFHLRQLTLSGCQSPASQSITPTSPDCFLSVFV